MIKWLDALGLCKWPSLILIASPIAAYPSWVPREQPALDCGLVELDGRLLRAFKRADSDEFVLRPTKVIQAPSAILDKAEPRGFDAGGMIARLGDDAQRLRCKAASSGAGAT